MARNTNKDRLIQTFLSRNRRTTPGGYKPGKQGVKPAGPIGYRPMPTGGQGAMFSRSRKPPRSDRFANQWATRQIPGFGQVQEAKVAQRVNDKVYHYDKHGKLVLDKGSRASTPGMRR